jgi:hypothetical protein
MRWAGYVARMKGNAYRALVVTSEGRELIRNPGYLAHSVA